jgi:hypothetical protein
MGQCPGGVRGAQDVSVVATSAASPPPLEQPPSRGPPPWRGSGGCGDEAMGEGCERWQAGNWAVLMRFRTRFVGVLAVLRVLKALLLLLLPLALPAGYVS